MFKGPVTLYVNMTARNAGLVWKNVWRNRAVQSEFIYKDKNEYFLILWMIGII